MRGSKIPEPGETTIFMGADKDIPRQRAFNFGLWDKHRKNPERYWFWFEGVLIGSTMMQRLKYPLLFLIFTTFCISSYDVYLQPTGWFEFDLPIIPFNLSASSLGLLLVFRVEGSNLRYMQARLIWGDIVNVSRDLMQMSHNWGTTEEFADFSAYIALYPAALMCMLRRPEEHDLKVELDRAIGAKSSLTADDIEKCCSRPAGINAPMYILHRMRGLIKQMSLNPEERFAMETCMSRLVINVGACERILGTPIPIGYTVHTNRFLILWLGFIPMALEQSLGMGTVLAEMVLSFGLLGIEDCGIMLEEPFCVLPLEAMCNKIARESRGLQAANKKEMDAAIKESTTMKFAVPKAPPKKAASGGKVKGKAKGK